MFSEALSIMDKNAERLMVDELQEQLAEEREKNEALQKEVTATSEERDKIAAERDQAVADRDQAYSQLEKKDCHIAELMAQLAAGSRS